MCHNGFAAALNNEQNVTHVKLDCDCWKCSECASKLKNAWKLDIQTHLELEPVLFKGYIAPDEWTTKHKALMRAGARWLKVETKNEQTTRFLVIATANPGFLDRISTGKAVVAVKQAVNALKKPANTKHFRPITTCRAWKRKKTNGAYRFVAWISKKRFLDTMNLLAESIREKVHDGIEFVLCKVMPDSIQNALSALQCPNYSMETSSSSHRNSRTTCSQLYSTATSKNNPQPCLSG